jgi:hypothetical protein
LLLDSHEDAADNAWLRFKPSGRQVAFFSQKQQTLAGLVGAGG